MGCTLCPRKCNVNREEKPGYCGTGKELKVAKACLHMWEEPCISGVRGSGTVFFSGCNLKCKYCQNYAISQENMGKEISVDRLREIYQELQDKGAHNINLVNPSHYIEKISESLLNTGLEIPVVYNSNAYESPEGLKKMEGLVQIYLPDMKYFDSETARLYSGAGDYCRYASAAILEMVRQVGETVMDEEGMMQKGIMIRHLILPGHAKESIRILDWIRENLPRGTFVSLMSQYTPCYQSGQYPEINRRITRWEYDKVVSHFYQLGFENGFIQDRASAEEAYIPDFNLDGV